MSFPAEGLESTYKNHIDDVKSYLDSRHHDRYYVFNLTQRSYKKEKFNNRVSHIKYTFSMLNFVKRLIISNIPWNL